QRHIEDPLADFVLMSNLEPGSTIVIDRREGEEEVDISIVAGPKVPVAVGPAPDAPDESDDEPSEDSTD
ncbi:MAG TPA: hypothetical protein VHS03_05290, partial [Gaiellaceae bacterium]|nr:hypothetical protein [Gaiellaceae bacterium]